MLKVIKILTLFAVCGLASAQNRQLYGNPDEIMFPSDISSRSSEPKKSPPGLPLDLARILNSVDSVDDFLRAINVKPKDREVLVQSRFGEEERSNAVKPELGKCIPELQLISFYQDNGDPSISYVPGCTRVKRCGGCCGTGLLSCQPTATVITNFKVLTMKQYPGEFPTFGEEIIPVEEHTSCKCDCTVKAEHCTVKQKYIKEHCSCECMNKDEEEKCTQLNDTKIWNPTRCTCECRQELECSTGNYFDPVTCRCQKQRWFNIGRGTPYDVPGTSKSRDSSPVIVPFGSDNRRRQNKDDPEYK